MMRIPFRRGAISALVILGALGPTARAAEPLPRQRPEQVGMSSVRLKRIGEVLERDVAAGRMPGAVVAIARKGKLVFYEAFGYLDRAAGTRMPKDAVFQLASMTKPFTGVATMILQEEGRLHLAEPAAKYLPVLGRMQVAAPGSEAAGKGAPIATVPQRVPMTIQDLMRHTAGMTYAWEGQSPVYKMWPNSAAEFAREEGATFLGKLEKLPLVHQPASVWEYSVSNDVLGLLLEAIAQERLGAFLTTRLFAPLGMVDTGFLVRPGQTSRYARALPKDPDTGQPQTIMDGTKPPGFDCGGACAVSTAADYVRFGQMLLEGGKLGRVRVLGRKSVELLTSDALGSEISMPVRDRDPTRRGVGYGLTLSVRTEPGVSPYLGSKGEFGWGGAYGTQFWVDPQEQLVVVFMAHTPGTQRQHYRQLMGSLVLQAIDD